MLGEYARRYGYWVLDFLKGSKIRKNYKKIKNIIENNIEDKEQLENILTYARENVSFYKEIKESKLENFPIVTKSDYMRENDNLKSQEYLNDDSLHKVMTGGSTGTPFKGVQDKIKRNMVVASLIYFHEKAGFKLGERYLMLRALTSYYIVSKLRMFTQNYITIDVIGMDENRCEDIRSVLMKKKIKVIMGYASAIETLVNYLEKKNDNYKMFKVKTVLTGSDTLKADTKKRIEKMFNCVVCDRYSNEEQGMIGMTLPHSNKFVLNTACYYYEILKLDSDTPAKPGELGRLVITDLYNHAMPFIRYDTGDLVKSSDKGFIKTFDSLEGRTGDLLADSNGNPISSVSINNHMDFVEGVEKYQVIQETNKDYKVLIVKRNNNFNEKQCIDTMKYIFGNGANIAIKIVDKIECLKNGKFKTTIKKQ